MNQDATSDQKLEEQTPDVTAEKQASASDPNEAVIPVQIFSGSEASHIEAEDGSGQIMEEKGTHEAKEQLYSGQEESIAPTNSGASIDTNGGKLLDEGEKRAKDSVRAEQVKPRPYRERERQPNGKHHPKFNKRNNKFDPGFQEKSSDHVEIRKQVEFYFSTSNLLTDRFLFTKLEGHKNVPVPLDIILSFKRMRRFEPRSAVIEALKDSKFLNLVDNDTAIQRKEPLPEDLAGKPMNEVNQVHETSSMARSVYVKGFGPEQTQTQFDIEAFFANHGPTNSVRLRRHGDGAFKGSVFVEFDSEDTQKAFLSLEPKPKWNGNDLLIKSKKEYCDDKVEDIKAGKIRPNSPRPDRNNEDRKFDKRNRNRDDNRDWRDRRDEDRKNGFKDRSGNRHGAHGKDRGQKDSTRSRDEEQKAEDHTKDQSHSTAPSVDAPNPSTSGPSAPPVDKALLEGDAEAQVSSRKRPLEDAEGESEVQGKDKKLDVKGD